VDDFAYRKSYIMHAYVPNMFYCSRTKKFSQDVRTATIYHSHAERQAGLREIELEYKTFRNGCLIMHYLQ